MIKTSLVGLTVYLLTSSPVSAQLIRTDYVQKIGPAKIGEVPPTLTERQFKQLIDKLREKDAHLTDQQATKVEEGLGWADILSDRKIGSTGWDAAIQEGLKAVETKPRPKNSKQWEDLVDADLKATIEKLHLPHSQYLNEKDFKQLRDELEQKGFFGIGAILRTTASRPPLLGAKVDFIMPNSPAKSAGLMEGDIIVKVKGHDAEKMPLDKIVDAIRGPQGTSVSLRVRRGSQSLNMSITRGPVESKIAFSKMIAPDIGYVHFAEFGTKTAEIVLSLIDELLQAPEPAHKLVIDLRSNPGGSTDTVGKIVSEFLSDGQQIVAFKRQGEVLFEEVTKGTGRYVNIPLAVLVNEDSASASEIMAGALQDYKRATIIGARTFGKGSMQEIRLISSDQGRSAVKITTAKWFTPSGRTIQGQVDPETDLEIHGTGGVVPDVPVYLTDAEKKSLSKYLLQRTYDESTPPVQDLALEKAVDSLNAAP